MLLPLRPKAVEHRFYNVGQEVCSSTMFCSQMAACAVTVASKLNMTRLYFVVCGLSSWAKYTKDAVVHQQDEQATLCG